MTPTPDNEPDTDTVPAVDVAQVGDPVEYDEAAERAEAAAASRASLDAARPRDPRPSTVDNPETVMSRALRHVLDTMPDDKYTPVVLPLPALAQAAATAASGLPSVPTYHPDDTPGERYIDRIGSAIEEGAYVPVGVVPGGLPTGRSVAVERVAEGVTLAVRPPGRPRDEPEHVIELDLSRGFALAMTILSAVYAPEPDPTPVDGSS